MPKSVRKMLTMRTELDYEINIMDTQTAFLNDDMKYEVFKVPPGDERSNMAGAP